MSTSLDPAPAQDAGEARMELRVRQLTYEAEGVISLVLERADRGALPHWDAGSHLDLILPSGLVRQYSLCSDPDDDRVYRVAVLREPESRGGSLEIHDSALIGRSIEVRGPRNHFTLEPADRYLFVAGGIGITPIIPMIQRAEEAGKPWRLVYGGRTRAHMAFLDEITRRSGGVVDLLPQDEVGIPDLNAIVGAAELGTAIYSCGPPAMLNALEQVCEAKGLGPALHIERFTVDPDDAADGLAGDDDEFATFEVELAKNGTVITVPPDRTVLRCVRDVVPSILFSCEDGYCGTCETRVLAGIPDHRDTVLSDAEKAANDTMMICVSRSKSARLVLDV